MVNLKIGDGFWFCSWFRSWFRSWIRFCSLVSARKGMQLVSQFGLQLVSQFGFSPKGNAIFLFWPKGSVFQNSPRDAVWFWPRDWFVEQLVGMQFGFDPEIGS